MIRDYPPSAVPVWRLIAQEALALLGIGALCPFGRVQSEPLTPRRREQRTVVLVHGYLSSRSALLPLAQYLRDGISLRHRHGQGGARSVG